MGKKTRKLEKKLRKMEKRGNTVEAEKIKAKLAKKSSGNPFKKKIELKKIDPYHPKEYNSDMPLFIIMIGPAGSGKSTKVKKIIEKIKIQDSLMGYYDRETLVLSSDSIRAELFGADYIYDKTKNQEVFALLHKRIKDNCADKNIIIDATNLTIKTRKSLLNCTKKRGNPYFVAYVMTTPVAICGEQNKKRTGTARVPDEVIIKHTKAFEIPIYDEGFDCIIFDKWNDEKIKEFKTGWNLKEDIIFKQMVGFDQKNPHHKYTLDRHTMNVVFNLTQEYFNKFKKPVPKPLVRAATLHDIGKLYTGEQKVDENGEVIPNHYTYKGHANYGTYILLSNLDFLGFNNKKDIIDCLAYINYHMEPFAWRTTLKDGTKKILPKTMQKMMERFPSYIDNMLLFNECDKKASGAECN